MNPHLDPILLAAAGREGVLTFLREWPENEPLEGMVIVGREGVTVSMQLRRRSDKRATCTYRVTVSKTGNLLHVDGLGLQKAWPLRDSLKGLRFLLSDHFQASFTQIPPGPPVVPDAGQDLVHPLNSSGPLVDHPLTSTSSGAVLSHPWAPAVPAFTPPMPIAPTRSDFPIAPQEAAPPEADPGGAEQHAWTIIECDVPGLANGVPLIRGHDLPEVTVIFRSLERGHLLRSPDRYRSDILIQRRDGDHSLLVDRSVTRIWVIIGGYRENGMQIWLLAPGREPWSRVVCHLKDLGDAIHDFANHAERWSQS